MQRISHKRLYRPFFSKDLRSAIHRFNDWANCNIFTKDDPPEGINPVKQLYMLLSEVYYRTFDLSESNDVHEADTRDVVQLFLRYDAIDENNSLRNPKHISRQIPPLMMAGRYVILFDIITSPDLLKEWAEDER
jgi:hypothetical protein